VVLTKVVRLPKGGRGILVVVRSLLTRYDLLASAIYARRQGEVELTKDSLTCYLRRILEESGVEGFISILNDADEEEKAQAEESVSQLFPKL